jgi:hypothetical protein
MSTTWLIPNRFGHKHRHPNLGSLQLRSVTLLCGSLWMHGKIGKKYNNLIEG